VRYVALEESSVTFDRDSYALTQMTIGFGASFKHVLSENIVLSMGGGLGRNIARNLVREEGQTGDFLSLGWQATSDLDIYARITVGYRFRYKSS